MTRLFFPGKLLGSARLALIVAAILGIYGFEAHARRNVESLPAARSDQAAYLQYAKQMRESGYSFEGDRNRMPVFPFLLSLVYRPGISEAEFLAAAQAFNINLTIILLLLSFLTIRRFFTSLYSVALLVITAFGVWIYRAGVVQVEPLFYFLSFIAFLLLLQMLVAPTYFLAIAAGAVLGLAFLTKASVVAALPIWGVVFLTQSFLSREPGLVHRLSQFGVLIASFVLCVAPYIWTSKQRYGQFFYNVNSAHYMWCDSWPEALTYSDKLRNPETRNSSIDELPSFKKYWHTHSTAQIFDRLLDGLKSLSKRSIKFVGYYKFAAFLAAVAVALIVRHRRRFYDWVAQKPGAAIFCLLFFATYIVLYAWYGAVVTDSRFVLTLFLPFIFSASIIIWELARDQVFVIASRKYSAPAIVAVALIGLALIDIIYYAGRIIQAQELPGAS